MNILYDSQAFDMQKFGGVSNYFYNIIKEIKKTPNHIDVGILGTDNEYMWNLNYLSKINFYNVLLRNKIDIEKYKNLPYSNLLYGTGILFKKNPDILHITFFYESGYINIFDNRPELKAKKVITIHDLIPEVYNWEDGNNIQIENRGKLIDFCDAIICPSESTKNDILKYYPNTNKDKIHVIHHGIEDFAIEEYHPPLDNPYILYVGGRMEYKGWSKFIRNAKKFLFNHPEFKVFATGENLSEEEKEELKELGLEDRVISFYVNREQLANLYHYALCLIFPSEYEGFGLPILEAWSNECITLLNDIPVFREIASGVAKFFDINKEDDVSEKLEEIVDMSYNKRQLIINKQNKKVRDGKYTWENSAKEHLKVYQSLL